MKNFFRTNFYYEEDEYDRLENIVKNKDKYEDFTKRATLRTLEFDYEEDPYEPEIDFED